MKKWTKNHARLIVLFYCAAWITGLWLVFSAKIPWWVSIPLLVAIGGLTPDLSTIREVFSKSGNHH